MKVFDLRCSLNHRFEGWFSSDDDYAGQQQRGLLTCPMCDSPHIEKLLSAPRLNLGPKTSPEQLTDSVPSTHLKDQPALESNSTALSVTQMQSLWLQVAHHIVAHTEDVGKAFAQEARKMHHGETPERPIRGQATYKEVQQLADEGVEVMQLPLPASAKETLQ